MIKIPIIEQSPKLIKVLKPNCTVEQIDSTMCFEYKRRNGAEFKFDYINKTIYEKKFDCCPGWVHVYDIPGCTKSQY